MEQTNKIPVTRRCPNCGKYQTVYVYADDLEKYMNGKNCIQNIFPYLTKDEREILQSGMCPECWDEVIATQNC